MRKSFGQSNNAKQQRCIPVACRVDMSPVPMDQWFTTHIDQSWYVQDLKIWLLSKALPSGVLPLPASYRPSSPVLFAANSSKAGASSTPAFDTGKTDELDSDVLSISTTDIFDASYTHYVPNNNVLADSADLSGLQAVAPYSYQRGEFTSSDRTSDPSLLGKMIALSKRWQVYSFSTGMMLSEEVPLSEYSLCPHYLFELHRTGDYIPIPKELPDDFWNMAFSESHGDGKSTKPRQMPVWAYKQPYFETWAWVFTALQAGKATVKDTTAAPKQHGYSVGGWKKVWIVVQDGFLFLRHEKSDATPVCKLDLGECIGLSGEDKIKPIVNSYFHGLDNNALNFVPHWHEGGPAISPAPKNRNMKFAVCFRFRRPYSIKQNSLIYTQLYENCSWVLLDFPDKTTYEHLLRVLHRLLYFNPTLLSENLPSYLYPRRTLQTDFLPNPIPPPQPIRFARATSPVSTIVDDGASSSSKTTVASSQLGLGDSFGVMYPEWREQVLRQAMISTHGYSFEGLMWSRLPKPGGGNGDDEIEYDSPVSDISDEPSELEWRGWAYDLDRPKTRDFFTLEERRNSIEFSQQDEEPPFHSLQRNRTQSIFSLGTMNSSVAREAIADMSTPIVGRTRSSTLSLKKPSFTSPKNEPIPLPDAESSSSAQRFKKALGGKSSKK